MVKTEIDFGLKCRACFSEELEMHHLYTEFDQGLTLSDIIKSTTSFEVAENDGFSSYLCESCTTIIVDFFNFKTIYQENEKYITSLTEGNNFKGIIILNSATDSDDKTDTEDVKEIKTRTSAKEHFNYNTIENETENAVKTEVKESVNMPVITDIEKNVEDKKLDITGGFVEPQELLEQKMAINENENISEYKTANIQIIYPVKFSCGMCGDNYILKSEFQQHLLQKHKISIFESGKFGSKPTIAITNMTSLQMKNDNDASQCHICKEEFKTRSEIEAHYMSHKKYICECCGAAFVKKSYLDDHFEIHTTEKRHVCPICNKAFRRRTVLIKHKKLHTHPRQCVCEICGLRFNDKGTLKTHIKLKHIKERNFHCTLCGLWFPLKSTLEKHIYRHSEHRERAFICSVCNMAYRDKSSLNRHVIVKHTVNAKKPSCKHCGKQYTTNTNLLKHIRKYHSSSEGKGNRLNSD